MRPRPLSLFLKILVWLGVGLALGFVVLVVVRIVQLKGEERTAAEVGRIHSTKLALDDVMGVSTPPDPGERADDTIQGIDANQNNIRDDVELAIFKAYPNSAKTRAVLLQYALALQMEMVQEIVNGGTVVAVAQTGDKASMCIGEIVSREDIQKFIDVTRGYVDFVEHIQLNTDARKKAQQDFYKGNLESYSSLDEICDIDLSSLPN